MCLHGGALAALESDEERRHLMQREFCSERIKGKLGKIYIFVLAPKFLKVPGFVVNEIR